MAEYISREATVDAIKKIYCPQCDSYNGVMCRACEHMDDMDIIEDMPAADVQPLSVAAEHIKNRLYETALNETEFIASAAIADMAERIDFWISELKEGDTNG